MEHVLSDRGDSVGEHLVIGRPITNYRIYVLDEDHLPFPVGCDGELYIGGASLAKGYRNKSEMTRSRFFDNPFHEGLLYCTGDLPRFDHPEGLSVWGRVDGQVKIRGYRIELGDIEEVITDHRDVSDAVVVSKDDRLIAYCIRVASVSVPGGATKPTLNSIRGQVVLPARRISHFCRRLRRVLLRYLAKRGAGHGPSATRHAGDLLGRFRVGGLHNRAAMRQPDRRLHRRVQHLSTLHRTGSGRS